MNSSILNPFERQTCQKLGTEHEARRPGTTRRADIQGLRAIAVLMVIAYHAGIPLPGGFVGVDVFFVISGYVITALLRREWTTTGRIQFSSFYIRRSKRLMPALALMIVATTTVAFLVFPPFDTFQTTLNTALGALLLVANVVIARKTGDYFAAPSQSNPLLHTWSLSVEEQFYLAFPALMALGWFIAAKSSRAKRLPIIVLGTTAAISFLLAILGSMGFVTERGSWLLGFYSPITRVWEFAVGALLALAATQMEIRGHNRAFALSMLGTAALIVSLFFITDLTPFPGVWTLLPVIGTTLLLAAGTNSTNAITRGLSSHSLVRIGDLSYSLYLWHWPLIVFSKIWWPDVPGISLCAALLSFIPAVFSYIIVEQPIRDLAPARTRRITAIVLGTMFVPVGYVALLSLLPRVDLLPTDVRAAVTFLSDRHEPLARGCFTTGPYTQESIANCGWNVAASGAPLYLVGDSNAMHFAEAVIGAGEHLSRPVWVFAAPSCPLVDGVTFTWIRQSQFSPGPINAQQFAHCGSYVRFTLDWLQNAPPGIVFVAALDQKWWDHAIAVTSLDVPMTNSPEEKSAVLAQGLTSAVQTLKSAGHQVVLVQTIPTYRNPAPIWDPRGCSVPAIQNGSCSRSLPVAFIDNLQRTSRSDIVKVAKDTHSYVLDLRDWFCDTEVCSTDKPIRWQYADASHLTVAASQALVPRFLTVIQTATETPVGFAE